jgi:tripartite-type tricarboxylate transporter receptor subunit TctC
MMKARTLLRGSILSCALLVAALTSASAQNYPNRPVKFILPYAAGGTGDIIVRLLGTKLPGIWGQQLVVDNRTGAGGLIGTEAAARSDPDGYTLYLGTDGPLTVAASLHKRLPYHWKRDFAPVTMMAVSYQVMLVKASNPARDLAAFIANAKQKPGEINYGSIGIGSAPHLTAEIFKAAAGIEATHVPYRGSSAQAMTAMIAGDVQMLMNGTASSIPHIRSGALRALAITAPRRTENLAEIPTFTEFGLPSVDAVLWFAAMVPAGTPQPIIRKLHADLTQVLNDPEIKASLAARGLEVRAEGPEKLAEFLERDYVKFRDLLQKLNLQVE